MRKAARSRARAWAAGWIASLAALCATPRALAAEIVIAASPTPFSLPLYVAERQGFYAAEGLAVRLEVCPTGQSCMQRLFDGKAHMITTSELPVMFNSFEHDDYAMLATIASSTSNIRIVGRRSAGITDAASLAGKRVGVLLRSSLQYYLDVYLLFHAIEPSAVQKHPLEPKRYVDALTSHEVDAFAGFAHSIEQARRRLGSDAVLLDQPRLYTETWNLVVGRPMAAEREADMAKLLRALDRANAFIAAQPEQAGRTLETQLKLEAGSAPALMSGITYRLALESALVGALEREARWAQREGYVPAERPVPPFLRYVAPGPLRTAVPAAAAN